MNPSQDQQPGEAQPEPGGGYEWLGGVLILLGILLIVPGVVFGAVYLFGLAAGANHPFSWKVGAYVSVAAITAGIALIGVGRSSRWYQPLPAGRKRAGKTNDPFPDRPPDAAEWLGDPKAKLNGHREQEDNSKPTNSRGSGCLGVLLILLGIPPTLLGLFFGMYTGQFNDGNLILAALVLLGIGGALIVAGARSIGINRPPLDSPPGDDSS